MSSCFAAIPISLQIGGMCAGHGICINSSNNMLLCQCDYLYNGASDFFDTQIETIEKEHLFLTCTNSVLGIYLVWSLWLFFGVIRIIILIPIWKNFYTKHYNDDKLNSNYFFYDTPFRIITMDLFLLTICYFIVGVTKILGMTFGTHILPTIALLFTLIFYYIIGFDIDKMQFDIFIRGCGDSVEAQKARKLRLILKTSSMLFTSTINCALSVFALLLNKSKGPIENGEQYIIYIRNINAVCFSSLEILTTLMILRRVKILKLVDTGGTDVNYVVKKMENEIKFYIIRAFILCMLYAIFSIPYLLPYQTYCIVLDGIINISIPRSRAFTTERERLSQSGKNTSKLSKENSFSIRGNNKPLVIEITLCDSDGITPKITQIQRTGMDTLTPQSRSSSKRNIDEETPRSRSPSKRNSNIEETPRSRSPSKRNSNIEETSRDRSNSNQDTYLNTKQTDKKSKHKTNFSFVQNDVEALKIGDIPVILE